MPNQKKWFGEVRWCNDDIAEALEERGLKATPDNIRKVRYAIDLDAEFRKPMVEAGWDAINAVIENELLGKEQKPSITAKNTLLSYMYRDAANYKIQLEEILTGNMTDDEIAGFNKKFSEKCFYPAKLGLKNTTFIELGYAPYPDDPDWHEFCFLEQTDREPTTSLTVHEFGCAFETGEIFADI